MNTIITCKTRTEARAKAKELNGKVIDTGLAGADRWQVQYVEVQAVQEDVQETVAQNVDHAEVTRKALMNSMFDALPVLKIQRNPNPSRTETVLNAKGKPVPVLYKSPTFIRQVA